MKSLRPLSVTADIQPSRVAALPLKAVIGLELG